MLGLMNTRVKSSERSLSILFCSCCLRFVLRPRVSKPLSKPDLTPGCDFCAGIYAFVSLKEANEPSDALKKEMVSVVRKEIGAFASPDVIHWAPGETLQSFSFRSVLYNHWHTQDLLPLCFFLWQVHIEEMKRWPPLFMSQQPEALHIKLILMM